MLRFSLLDKVGATFLSPTLQRFVCEVMPRKDLSSRAN
ncbi:mCG1036765 [Mus musculus]|nr:mCG1036765 [Mus musculus]